MFHVVTKNLDDLYNYKIVLSQGGIQKIKSITKKENTKKLFKLENESEIKEEKFSSKQTVEPYHTSKLCINYVRHCYSERTVDLKTTEPDKLGRKQEKLTL